MRPSTSFRSLSKAMCSPSGDQSDSNDTASGGLLTVSCFLWLPSGLAEKISLWLPTARVKMIRPFLPLNVAVEDPAIEADDNEPDAEQGGVRRGIGRP